MTLRFMDSCETFTTAQILRKYTRLFGGPTVQSTTTRLGTGQAFYFDRAYVEKTLPAAGTWVVGLAVRMQALPSSGLKYLIMLADGTSLQVGLGVHASGALHVGKGGSLSTSLGNSGANVLVVGTWYYVELKVTIHDTAGAFEVRVNAMPWVGPTTGQNTRSTANNTANVICIGCAHTVGDQAPGGGTQQYVEDIYALDSAGTLNNDFLGDSRVDCLRPSGSGASSQWSPVGAASNWDCVNDTVATDDTDYVQSNTPGSVDTYAFSDVPTPSASIAGVQTVILCRKDQPGSRALAPVLRVTGTDYTAGNSPLVAASVPDSYLYDHQILEQSPAGGAFTDTVLNALESGGKLIS